MKKILYKLLEFLHGIKKTGESFLLVNREEQKQILEQYRWERRKDFEKIMVDYLENSICLNEYSDLLYELDCNIEKLNYKFKKRTFERELDSDGFSILIEQLYKDIQFLVFEPSNGWWDEEIISEKTLRNRIKRLLVKIKEY
jgi:hypothetical protein